jgi:hypothetical protein
MGIGASLVVFAVGAVMRFAVTVTTTGFNLHTVGVILMIVGGVGFLLSLAFWSTWAGFGGGGRSGVARQRRTVVDGPTGITASTTEDRVYQDRAY